MRIGMVLLGGTKFPPDIRVEKEVKALVSTGHKISLLTEYSNEELYNDNSYIDGLRIIRVPIKNRSSVRKLLSFQYFHLIDKRYFKYIKDFIDSEKPEILHVHDFHMLPTVFKCLDFYGIAIDVIADLHENYPAALKSYISDLPNAKKIISSFLLNYKIWRHHERVYLKRCAHIITVVEEANERLFSYGIPKDRITVVSNTENEDTFQVDNSTISTDMVEHYKNRFVVSYIGGIGPHRGLTTVLRALRECVESIPHFTLLIVGAKPDNIRRIEEIKKELGISDLSKNIEVVGWVPFSKVNEYVAVSDVCMVPHEDFEHTQTTIPHKLFQYMMGKKTILVSDCAPLKRIVGDTGAGYVFQAGNPHSFSEIIQVIVKESVSDIKRRQEKAYELATGTFSWTYDAEKLQKIY